VNGLPTAENTTELCGAPGTAPVVGELWSVAGHDSHAVYLGEEVWNVLTYINDEYTLEQVADLEPDARATEQPYGFHWADQFDALAAADGLRITWAEEILTYQAQGWDKIRKLPHVIA
jgi:hypothetical protein